MTESHPLDDSLLEAAAQIKDLNTPHPGLVYWRNWATEYPWEARTLVSAIAGLGAVREHVLYDNGHYRRVEEENRDLRAERDALRAKIEAAEVWWHVPHFLATEEGKRASQLPPTWWKRVLLIPADEPASGALPHMADWRVRV